MDERFQKLIWVLLELIGWNLKSFKILKNCFNRNIHRLYAIKIYCSFIRCVSGSCFPPRSALNSPLFFAIYLEELEAFRIHCRSSIITDLSTGLYFRESAIRNSFFRKKSPWLFSPLLSLIFQLACCISRYIIESKNNYIIN